jgi:hypothetical protein
VIDDEHGREVLGWDEFGVAARDLARTVHEDGFMPDLVLAIARGGLLIAGAITYALGTKNCCVLNVEYYTGPDERLELPVILPPSLDLVDLHDAHMLIVDDVADTGNTLALVVETVRPQVAELRTAVLYDKPRSIVRCDYVWRSTDRWIDFPWSSKPTVRGNNADGLAATTIGHAS